jgi:hypothetical protein
MAMAMPCRMGQHRLHLRIRDMPSPIDDDGRACTLENGELSEEVPAFFATGVGVPPKWTYPCFD